MLLTYHRCRQTAKASIAAKIANNIFLIYELIQYIAQPVFNFIDIRNIVVAAECDNRTNTPCIRHSLAQNH